jgi:tRNA (cmo5U34)-methyltransferase
MTTPLAKKSTTQDIQKRFDADVERFSNLETGQVATIDAPLAMELITKAAIAATPNIRRVLDIGSGAGNNTIKLLRDCAEPFECHLSDLSLPMLKRAEQRLEQEKTLGIRLFNGDFRHAEFAQAAYDVVIAAASLHHLRDDEDWLHAFAKIFRLLRPGGSFWITDLVFHEDRAIQGLMWERYGHYLHGIGGADYREKCFAYIDQEDSPRPMTYQLDLLRKVGFSRVDVLHKNSCFAAFGAIKSNAL